MADEKNRLDPEQDLAAQDAAFREQMANSNAPQDKRWRQYDNAARAQERQIGQLSGVAKLYDGLTQARGERDAFREDNERTPANAQGWDERYQALDQAAVDRQKEFQDGLKGASLDDIQSLQGDIARRQEELEQTIAARQDIAMLPSERAAHQEGQGQQEGQGVGQGQLDEAQRQDEDAQRERGMTEDDERKRRLAEEDRQEHGQAQGSELQADTQELDVAMPALDEWRARQVQGQDAEDEQEQHGQQAAQGMGEGPGGFHWRAYATSAAEAQANHQLEQDQTELAYRLGRTATTEEIDAYQAQRNQAQAGEGEEAGEQTQDRAQQAQGQDRTQGNQQGHGQDGEQPAQANQPERYTLGLGQVRRQGQQAQADAGPQPNSTYSQRRAQANQAAQGQEGGETVVDAEGLQQRRARRQAQGQGM